MSRLWQIIPPKITYYSILSKVAHYSHTILHSEHIVCKILPVLSCMQYKNDVKFRIYTSFGNVLATWWYSDELTPY